jgi:hypothetical protein
MAEKIKLTISPAVAAYVRPGTPSETRLSGCAAAAQMPVSDRFMLLFCLSKDADPAVRAAALSCLKEIPGDSIREYVASANPNPLVLSALPLLCQHFQAAAPAPEIDQTEAEPEAVSNTVEDQYPEEGTDAQDAPDMLPDTPDDASAEGEESDDDPVDEEDEQFLSKYKTAQMMGIGEKIKMALSGDKEWRAILVKDSNKLVSGSVIKNPRISEAEILTLIKAGIQNDEIMRLICANKEWIKNYQIRKALIENNRTPVQNAMRYLGTMGEKDLASFAKSKNISSVIATLAKRLLLNKKK